MQVRVSWVSLDVEDAPAVSVAWAEFDTLAKPVSVEVGWAEFDTQAKPVQVQVGWAEFDVSAKQPDRIEKPHKPPLYAPGLGVGQYYNDASQKYSIPVDADETEEEEIIIAILLEIAAHAIL